jgi:hypothetical protein
LKDIVLSARYWQREYKKTHHIGITTNSIFTEEVYTKWESMSHNERLALLESYAIQIGEILGDGMPIVHTITDNTNKKPSALGSAGVFSDNGHMVYKRDGTITLNAKFFNDNSIGFSLDKAIFVVLHEVRHQYQGAVAIEEREIVSQNPGVYPISPLVDVPSQLAFNWMDYRNYDPRDKNDLSKYWQHPIEIDARAFAGLSVV